MLSDLGRESVKRESGTPQFSAEGSRPLGDPPGDVGIPRIATRYSRTTTLEFRTEAHSLPATHLPPATLTLATPKMSPDAPPHLARSVAGFVLGSSINEPVFDAVRWIAAEDGGITLGASSS